MGLAEVTLTAAAAAVVGLLVVLGTVTTTAALDPLNVHVVAHSHDDVGWLKTVDQYYYGANNSIQVAGVQYILDSVVPALLQNPQRRFIYVEIAFFTRWWYEQSEEMKNTVRQLVRERRLEFINGGWCMNDEASTLYPAIIDQMTEGHLFLEREFGALPKIGWHIDPFGHASTQASLFAQMGFDAFFFWRIDYQDMDLRYKQKQLELVWRGSYSLGKETEIFTSIMRDGYYPPPGFCFQCNVPPVQDDPRLFDVNVKQLADNFAKEVRDLAAGYRTSNVLFAFGGDFQYENANINFKNMDKLMKYFREHQDEYGLNVLYSTPSIYVEAVHKASEEMGLTWKVKTDDFFPYADNAHSFWTGYFTSRPALKGYVRTRSNLLHSTEKLMTTAQGNVDGSIAKENIAKYQVLAEALGVAQHHDAVSGTEKQHVADDYALRLAIGSDNAEKVMTAVMAKLVTRQNKASPTPEFTLCPLMNVSVCESTLNLAKNQVVPVVAYNPLGWSRTHHFRIPVPIQNVAVVVSSKTPIVAQVTRSGDLTGLPFIVAFSLDLPPMGYVSFVLQPGSSNNNGIASSSLYYESAKSIRERGQTVSANPKTANVVLENRFLSATFSGTTGRLSVIENKQSQPSQKVVIDQGLFWYNASTGNNALSTQPSGAYIFRPNETFAYNMTKDNIPSMQLVTGKVYSEVRQVFNSWATQVVRLYADQPFLEFEYTIGPIDISNGLGKEVITRYATQGFPTGQTWYTDSQGLEMQKRRYNYRPTWPYKVNEPVAGNYYPMNAAAFLRSDSLNAQITIVNDRSQGCGSVADGQIEMMLHRRLLHDDYRGVGEPLNETEAVRTVHRLTFGSSNEGGRNLRTMAYHINNPPTLFFASFKGDANAWFTSYEATYEPLTASLPPNVHVLNLRALSESGEVLVRLQHIYATDEDSSLSRPAQVNLATLFKNLKLVSIKEMSLSGNQLKTNVKRLQWKTDLTSSAVTDQHGGGTISADLPVVDLRPMEIRTFIVQLQRQ